MDGLEEFVGSVFSSSIRYVLWHVLVLGTIQCYIHDYSCKCSFSKVVCSLLHADVFSQLRNVLRQPSLFQCFPYEIFCSV